VVRKMLFGYPVVILFKFLEKKKNLSEKTEFGKNRIQKMFNKMV